MLLRVPAQCTAALGKAVKGSAVHCALILQITVPPGSGVSVWLPPQASQLSLKKTLMEQWAERNTTHLTANSMKQEDSLLGKWGIRYRCIWGAECSEVAREKCSTRQNLPGTAESAPEELRQCAGSSKRKRGRSTDRKRQTGGTAPESARRCRRAGSELSYTVFQSPFYFSVFTRCSLQ